MQSYDSWGDSLGCFSKKCFFPPPGFTGELCEENINDCVPEPCHHGLCKDGIAMFSCECYPGYTGSICNIQVQECHSNPCQNRGRCIDLVNAYQCHCPPGTAGTVSTHCAANDWWDGERDNVLIVCARLYGDGVEKDWCFQKNEKLWKVIGWTISLIISLLRNRQWYRSLWTTKQTGASAEGSYLQVNLNLKIADGSLRSAALSSLS